MEGTDGMDGTGCGGVDGPETGPGALQAGADGCDGVLGEAQVDGVGFGPEPHAGADGGDGAFGEAQDAAGAEPGAGPGTGPEPQPGFEGCDGAGGFALGAGPELWPVPQAGA